MGIILVLLRSACDCISIPTSFVFTFYNGCIQPDVLSFLRDATEHEIVDRHLKLTAKGDCTGFNLH